MKTKDNHKVRVGSWIEDSQGTYEVLWIASNDLGLRAAKIDFDENLEDGLEITSDIRLFDDDQVAEMQMVQY